MIVFFIVAVLLAATGVAYRLVRIDTVGADRGPGGPCRPQSRRTEAGTGALIDPDAWCSACSCDEAFRDEYYLELSYCRELSEGSVPAGDGWALSPDRPMLSWGQARDQRGAA